MDYEYLEETHVQEVRFRAYTKSFYGVAGWMIYMFYQLLDTFLSAVCAIVIVFPAFINVASENKNLITSGWFAVILLAVVMISGYASYKTGVRAVKKSREIDDCYNYDYNKKYYYLDMFAEYDKQKDIRICNYRNVLLKDIDQLFEKLKECQRKIGVVNMFCNSIDQCFLKCASALIYIFFGLRAYIGIISIGNVATYAASMVRFMQSISGFSRCVGHTVSSIPQYAADYYEFMNLEKRKYEGTIPVEKRRDNRFQCSENSFQRRGKSFFCICISFAV